MIYRRDAKKGEATYSSKSHSASHFVGHFVEGMEEWASWYSAKSAAYIVTLAMSMMFTVATLADSNPFSCQSYALWL